MNDLQIITGNYRSKVNDALQTLASVWEEAIESTEAAQTEVVSLKKDICTTQGALDDALAQIMDLQASVSSLTQEKLIADQTLKTHYIVVVAVGTITMIVNLVGWWLL